MEVTEKRQIESNEVVGYKCDCCGLTEKLKQLEELKGIFIKVEKDV